MIVCAFCLADDHLLCDPVPWCECLACPWLQIVPDQREADQ